MKNIKVLIISLVIGSCARQDSFEKDLQALSNKYTFLDTRNWHMDKAFQDEFHEVDYHMVKARGDTSESASFFISDGKFRLYDYEIEYVSDLVKHHIRIDDFDTSYYYQENIDTDSMIFLKGYYTYMYFEGHYTFQQLNYYFANEDSLKKILGGNLPILPSIK